MTKSQTNLCKGIAIIMMFVHHMFLSTDSFEGYIVNFAPFPENRFIQIAQFFKICVSVFALLTGYGYARTSSSQPSPAQTRTSLTQSCTKRYFRVMFGYWFIFVLAQAVNLLLGKGQLARYGTGRDFALNLVVDILGLANLFGTSTFNSTWWYITYAVLFVFLAPWIVKLVRKMGYSSIIVAIILPRLLIKADAAPWRYIFPVILGAYCAEFHIFEKVSSCFRSRRVLEFFLLTISVVLCALLRTLTNWVGIFDGVCALTVCLFCAEFLFKIPLLNKGLTFIGTHSMNCFMLHTFIYRYFFESFIYSFRFWWLITLVLLAICLALSFIIEQVKKLIRYNRLESLCIERTVSLLSRLERQTLN